MRDIDVKGAGEPCCHGEQLPQGDGGFLGLHVGGICREQLAQGLVDAAQGPSDSAIPMSVLMTLLVTEKTLLVSDEDPR
jgi:hypothetical protein